MLCLLDSKTKQPRLFLTLSMKSTKLLKRHKSSQKSGHFGHELHMPLAKEPLRVMAITYEGRSQIWLPLTQWSFQFIATDTHRKHTAAWSLQSPWSLWGGSPPSTKSGKQIGKEVLKYPLLLFSLHPLYACRFLCLINWNMQGCIESSTNNSGRWPNSSEFQSRGLPKDWPPPAVIWLLNIEIYILHGQAALTTWTNVDGCSDRDNLHQRTFSPGKNDTLDVFQSPFHTCFFLLLLPLPLAFCVISEYEHVTEVLTQHLHGLGNLRCRVFQRKAQ